MPQTTISPFRIIIMVWTTDPFFPVYTFITKLLKYCLHTLFTISSSSPITSTIEVFNQRNNQSPLPQSHSKSNKQWGEKMHKASTLQQKHPITFLKSSIHLLLDINGTNINTHQLISAKNFWRGRKELQHTSLKQNFWKDKISLLKEQAFCNLPNPQKGTFPLLNKKEISTFTQKTIKSEYYNFTSVTSQSYWTKPSKRTR